MLLFRDTLKFLKWIHFQGHNETLEGQGGMIMRRVHIIVGGTKGEGGVGRMQAVDIARAVVR